MTKIPIKVKRPLRRSVIVLCSCPEAAVATVEAILATGREPLYLLIRSKEEPR